MVLRIQSKLGGGNKVRLGYRKAPRDGVRTLTDERIEAIAEQVYLAVRRLEAAAARPSPGLSSPGLSSSIAGHALPMQPKRSLADRQRPSGLHLVRPLQAATEQAATEQAATRAPDMPDATEAPDAKGDAQARIAPRKARRDLSYPMDVHRMKDLRERRMPDTRQLARMKAAVMQGRLLPGRRRQDMDRQEAEVSTTGPPVAGSVESAREWTWP
ncbi:hypothetical protein OMP38_34175 [Cohnella ginsengisoli]|uniref:Uncharacterized protein n=1 Tax=Cohnella ginsengisoli TaxID=425004 RepID=A0A9X4KN21_9BACL|nr:hypothetical protein [Cohnella ginsengisoli]MDG0795312.1 hypothetical protein [Cohnella ginsengisoli]